jgi:hypothetical protein
MEDKILKAIDESKHWVKDQLTYWFSQGPGKSLIEGIVREKVDAAVDTITKDSISRQDVLDDSWLNLMKVLTGKEKPLDMNAHDAHAALIGTIREALGLTQLGVIDPIEPSETEG